jgi:hypothetical protein
MVNTPVATPQAKACCVFHPGAFPTLHARCRKTALQVIGLRIPPDGGV